MSNMLEIVSGIGAIQCILLSILILLKQKKHVSDWILFFWFLVFFIHLIIWIDKELDPSYTMEVFIMTIGFLHGPLFYVYTKSVLNYQEMVGKIGST